MKFISTRLALLPLAGAMALVIAACGDENTTTGAGRVPTGTATASATATGTAAATATPGGSPTGTPGIPGPGQQTFVRGRIQSISGNMYQVAGNTVQTDSSTAFNNADGTPTTASAFHVGDRVRVVGFINQDGSVFARKFSFDTP